MPDAVLTTAPIAFWILGGLAAFSVGMGKGGLPGIGSLAVPLMSLVISPVLAAGLLLPIFIASDCFGLWAYRREFSLQNLKIIIPGAAVGIAIGWSLFSVVSESHVRLMVGLIGLAFCLHVFLKRNVQAPPRYPDWPRGLFWGAVSGLTSFVSHSGATPYQVYVLPQKLPKMVYAGTTTIAFAAINLLKLPPYVALGQVTLHNAPATLILMLIAVGGAFAGFRLTKIIPERTFFLAVNVMLFLLSLKLTYDGITGLI
jgi:uncharacterized protein